MIRNICYIAKYLIFSIISCYVSQVLPIVPDLYSLIDNQCFNWLNLYYMEVVTNNTSNLIFNIYMYINPELLFLSLICIILIYCLVYSVSAGTAFITKMHFFSILIILCTFLFVYLFSFDEYLYDNMFDYMYYPRMDYNSIIELFILLFSLFIFFNSYEYNKKIGIFSIEYYIITLFCICSFCIFIHANNLMLMYVLIELQSIGSYVLTSLHRNNRYSIEAGLKYFVMGSFSSILILFGFSFLYGFTGLISIDDLSLYVRYIYIVEDSFIFKSLLFSFIFFNVGFLFKIYASPFHF